jgi:putative oxidoreductase
MEVNPLKEKSDSRHYPGWLTLLRIVLGLILLVKGFSFFHDSTALESIIRKKGWKLFDTNGEILSFILTYVTLLGGVFIAVGFITRWASLVQIPILIVAVFFINMEGGMSFSNKELLLSFITLVLSVLFVIRSSGPISADEFFRSYTKAGQERGHTKKFFQ